jgi:Na+(H+)/acetate symporter ActP
MSFVQYIVSVFCVLNCVLGVVSTVLLCLHILQETKSRKNKFSTAGRAISIYNRGLAILRNARGNRSAETGTEIC